MSLLKISPIFLSHFDRYFVDLILKQWLPKVEKIKIVRLKVSIGEKRYFFTQIVLPLANMFANLGL